MCKDREISVSSVQFCSEPTAAVKNKLLEKKKPFFSLDYVSCMSRNYYYFFMELIHLITHFRNT